VDVVVKGRHLEVSQRFRDHVQDKLAKVERLDPKVQRVDVEVSKETNPRLAERAYRVELTCRSRGPVIRAEASADEKYAALDVAYARLEGRLRKAADRRSDHRRLTVEEGGTAPAGDLLGSQAAAEEVEDDNPLVVREKDHVAAPMTLDQALYEMELVGHDFYLFHDAASDRPSVVYRRRGYDYGVIRLTVEPTA
jgi:ribosomal subunit interface protein